MTTSKMTRRNLIKTLGVSLGLAVIPQSVKEPTTDTFEYEVPVCVTCPGCSTKLFAQPACLEILHNRLFCPNCGAAITVLQEKV